MTTSSKQTVNTNATASQAFMRELDVLQKQQAQLTKKCAALTRKQRKYVKEIDRARQEVLELQAQSQNGARVIEDERSFQKQINKLEHVMQKLKIKLSVKRQENKTLVIDINEERKDKCLNLDILKGTESEMNDCKNSINESNQEILQYNEKKNKTKLELTKEKNTMITDMENFQDELKAARNIMSENQFAMAAGAKEKLELAMLAANMVSRGRSRATTADQGPMQDDVDGDLILQKVLDNTGVSSLEELMTKFNRQEAEDFRLYKDIQEKSEEVEKLETEYKRLSSTLSEQSVQVDNLEAKNAGRRADLEQHIKGIESRVAKHEGEYAGNLNVIASLSDSLTNIMRLIAVQGRAVDMQLLDGGINERNIPTFLSILEDRVDFIMQMSKAVNNEALKREDFTKLPTTVSGGVSGIGIQPPSIPSMEDVGDEEVDDNDNSKVVPVSIKSVKMFMDQKLFPKKARTTKIKKVGGIKDGGDMGGMIPHPPNEGGSKDDTNDDNLEIEMKGLGLGLGLSEGSQIVQEVNMAVIASDTDDLPGNESVRPPEFA